MSNTRGQRYEQLAFDFLTQQGLQPITRNYQSKMGEIDLIMKDQDVIVFVEVRFRTYDDFGGGLYSVEYHKQQKLIRTAEQYLQQRGLYDQVDCRFDVVAISKQPPHQIEWLQNAFEVF